MLSTRKLSTLLAAALLIASGFLGGCRSPAETRDVASSALQESLKGLSRVQYRGRRLYERYCLICHGENAKGDGFNAYNLDPPPPDLTAVLPEKEDFYLLKVIDEGTGAVGKSPLCPPRRGAVVPEEQKAILSYLRRLIIPKP